MTGQKGFDEIMIKWLVRYKKFAKAQFNINSKGGGIWTPLKSSTKKRVKKRSRLILRDSETLSQTLEPVPTLDKYPKPGIMTIRRKVSVTIAFGGTGKHPYSKLSIGRLAEVHHQGLGRVPSRMILVKPSDVVKRGMVKDVKAVATATKKRLGMK